MGAYQVIGSTYRVGYDGHIYVFIPDAAAGKRQRYTLYRLPGSPSRRARVVGRELTEGQCYALAERLESDKRSQHGDAK